MEMHIPFGVLGNHNSLTAIPHLHAIHGVLSSISSPLVVGNDWWRLGSGSVLWF